MRQPFRLLLDLAEVLSGLVTDDVDFDFDGIFPDVVFSPTDMM